MKNAIDRLNQVKVDLMDRLDKAESDLRTEKLNAGTQELILEEVNKANEALLAKCKQADTHMKEQNTKIENAERMTKEWELLAKGVLQEVESLKEEVKEKDKEVQEKDPAIKKLKKRLPKQDNERKKQRPEMQAPGRNLHTSSFPHQQRKRHH
jgi:chromosome segregation ATPase